MAGCEYRGPELTRKFKEASVLYSGMCEKYSVLQQMFPFPVGGEPNSENQATTAISLVEDIKALEIETVAKLKEILQSCLLKYKRTSSGIYNVEVLS